jgi:ADP-ribose pyrophosphatase
MEYWKTLGRETVFKHPTVVLQKHTVQTPNNKTIPDWIWIVLPDYVMVVAITPEHEFICFEQPKYGVDGTSLAPVGGYIDENESPLGAAKRELREETGYEASESDWFSLGQYRVDGNRGAGTAHFFIAQNVRKVTNTHSDDLEEQQLVRLNPEDLKQALVEGKFKVLPWAAIIALALLKMPTLTGKP